MKQIFTAVVILFTVGAVSAQAQFGFKGGVNFSSMSVAPHPSGCISFTSLDPSVSSSRSAFSQTSVGISFGGFYQIPLSKHFGFQLDLIYQGLGYGSVKTSYINLPVSATYRAGKWFVFSGGIYTGRLVGGNYDSHADYRKVDRGVSLGGEIKLNKRMAAGMKYYYGLTNAVITALEAGRNRALQVYISCSLRHK